MRLSRTNFPFKQLGLSLKLLELNMIMSLSIEIKKLNSIFLAALIASADVSLGQDKTQEQRIEALEKQLIELKGQAGKPDYLQQAASKGLTFNFYGTLKYKSGGGSQKADPHRMVLIPSYKLSDYAKFMAELEFEHGGVKDGANDRFSGAIELEQMYIDVQLTDNITWRSLGVSLIPVGTINEHHEPDLFYSAYRPQIYKQLIPTTWMEMSTGIHGDIPQVDGLSYNLLISQGPDANSGNQARGTDTASKWSLKNMRPDMNNNNFDDIATTLKLGYDSGGFSGSVSTYQSKLTNSDGESSDMDLYVASAAYRFQEGSLKGLELIGDYAVWDFGTPANITDSAVGDITWDEQKGYRLEAAYHIPRGDNELVPFVRHEKFDAGGATVNEKEYFTTGAMYKFGDNWEIKASYMKQKGGANELQLAVGVQF